MKFRRRTPRERAGLTRRTPKRRAPKRQRAAGVQLRTTKLGEVAEIVYRHTDGSMRRHTFRPRARISYTADGRFLVIDGASVKPFIE